MRNETSDLRFSRSDALPLSQTRVPNTARISDVDSVMFVNRIGKMVKLEKNSEFQKIFVCSMLVTRRQTSFSNKDLVTQETKHFEPFNP